MQLFASTLRAALAATSCLLSWDAAEGFAGVAVVGAPRQPLSSRRSENPKSPAASMRFRRQRPSPSSSPRTFQVTLCGLADADADAELDEDDASYDGAGEEEVPQAPLLDSTPSRTATTQTQISDPMERAWRHSKKPLLRVGAKGATLSHGNSLRQLLQAHTAVKVKVNTQPFRGDLREAFERIRALAEESGAPPGIECVQLRERDGVIMFGMPGTSERIASGDFPPPPPPAWQPPSSSSSEP
jgi:RNA-binding protein YhbY